MVNGQRLSGGGEVEDVLGVDALAGERVEVLRELDSLLVAPADVLDDAISPGLSALRQRTLTRTVVRVAAEG